jgi:LysR substrate binding domain
MAAGGVTETLRVGMLAINGHELRPYWTVPRTQGVLMTSLDHRLAGSGPVSSEVLADHSVMSVRSTEPEYWEDAFLPFFTPSGRAIPRNQAPIPTLESIYAIVSAGKSVHALGEHVTRFQVRPDIVYRLIEDGPELRWGLVWHAESEIDPVRALVRVVEDLGEARF